MTISIINHGSWARYTPDALPEGAPLGAMFCKRVSDGVDWYDYIRNGAVFAPGSIKATVDTNSVVQAVYRVADFLFPQDCVVIEITGDNSTADPQATYGGQVLDGDTLTLSTPLPPKVTLVTPRQARLALLQQGLLDTVQAAVDEAGGALKITWEYATEFNRNDAFIVSIGQQLGLTSDQIDALFALAATL